MFVAVDFDGTIVDHAYPEVGQVVPGAVSILRRLVDEGHKLILFTMRSGDHLDEAVRFCERQGIELTYVNTNPEQDSWTTSPKVYAHRYIDDAAVGTVMTTLPGFKRPCVDWGVIECALENDGFLVAQEHTHHVCKKRQELEDAKLLLDAILASGVDQTVLDDAQNLVDTWNGSSTI